MSTIYAASTSQADVNTAIGLAVAGDTVIVPAGSSSWTTGVAISGITLQGSGSGRIISYSEPSQTVGTGTKTLTLHKSGLAISNGQTLRISQNGTRTNYMEGTVTSYSGTTLVMDITTTGGSGTATRWLVSTVSTTVITHNVAVNPIVTLTEHTTYRTRFSHIKIKDGTGTGPGIGMTWASGGKAQLVHDCWLETRHNGGNCISSSTSRGVVWNCSFDSSPFSQAPVALQLHDPNNFINTWVSNSTMGANDTTGENNFYLEDNDYHAFLNATDFDSNARSVTRYSTFDDAFIGTHGADTSPYGQMHFEFYNNTVVRRIYSDGSSFPAARWFYIRGGTFEIHDNSFTISPNGVDYADPVVDMTVMILQRDVGGWLGCWGANNPGNQYPAPRQVGFGRVTGAAGNDAGGLYMGDSLPGYIWNNTGDTLLISISDYGGVECTLPDSSPDYIVLDRDYFLSAKPSATTYTYPHPLRNEAAVAASPAVIARIVRWM